MHAVARQRLGNPGARADQRRGGAQLQVLVHHAVGIQRADGLEDFAPEGQARGQREHGAGGRHQGLGSQPALGRTPAGIVGRVPQMGLPLREALHAVVRPPRKMPVHPPAQCIQHLLDAFRRHGVVGIEQQHHLAGAGRERGVGGHADAAVELVDGQDLCEARGIAVQHLRGVVGRAVVHHHDLVRRHGLGQAAVQALGQEAAVVEADDGDADLRHGRQLVQSHGLDGKRCNGQDLCDCFHDSVPKGHEGGVPHCASG